MEQKEGAIAAPPTELVEPIPERPGVPDRSESALPPHLRPSVTRVPVTPGITREAYESEASDKSEGPETGGYFARRAVDHAIASSPAPGATNLAGQSFQSKIDTGAQQGKDFLRRVSVAAMGDSIAPPATPSMHDIRASHPDLALTGNIISATFNIPHSLKYRKGADWVCAIFLAIFSASSPVAPQWRGRVCVTCSLFAKLRSGMVGLMSSFLSPGIESPQGPIGPLRCLFVPVIRRRAMESRRCRMDGRD